MIVSNRFNDCELHRGVSHGTMPPTADSGQAGKRLLRRMLFTATLVVVILAAGWLAAAAIQRQGSTYVRLAFSGSEFDSDVFHSPSAMDFDNLLYLDMSDQLTHDNLGQFSAELTSAGLSTDSLQTNDRNPASYPSSNRAPDFPKSRSDSADSERMTSSDALVRPAATAPPRAAPAHRARPRLKQAGCARCFDWIAQQRYTRRTPSLLVAVIRNLFRPPTSTHHRLTAISSPPKEAPLLVASLLSAH